MDVCNQIKALLSDQDEVVRYYIVSTIAGEEPPPWVLDQSTSDQVTKVLGQLRDLLSVLST